MHKTTLIATVIKWLTPFVALGGLVLGIVSLYHTQRLNKTDDALKIERLLSEATDLMYFGNSEELIKKPTSPKKLELAARRINEILIIDPHNIEGLRLSAQYLQAKGQIEDCIDQLRKAIGIEPSNADLYLLLGHAYAQKGNHAEAIMEYKKAIGIDSMLTAAYSSLGASSFEIKAYDESADAFKSAVKLYPKSAQTHYNLGYILYYQGKLEKAKKELCKVLEIDRNFLGVDELLAVVLYYQGRINNLNEEYNVDLVCPRALPAPRITTPFILNVRKNEKTGQRETLLMWKNPSTGELKPIGEWWE